MTDKTISKNSYVWSHVAVIIFHTLIGAALVYLAYRKSLFGLDRRTTLLSLGVIMIVVSLLGLVPILQNYDSITVE